MKIGDAAFPGLGQNGLSIRDYFAGRRWRAYAKE